MMIGLIIWVIIGEIVLASGVLCRFYDRTYEKKNEEIKSKYFYLVNGDTNDGMIYRKLTDDEFAKYDCGSTCKINNKYYKVVGFGDTTYCNKYTGYYFVITEFYY